MKPLWLNALAFQCVWWALVLYRDSVAIVCLLGFLLVHYCWVEPRLPAQHRVNIHWVLLIALYGIAMDGVLFALNVLHAPGGFPLWLAVLWLCFGYSVLVSLRALLLHLPAAMVLFALFGPLSYWAGMQLTSIQLGRGVTLWLAVALPLWALLPLWVNRLLVR